MYVVKNTEQLLNVINYQEETYTIMKDELKLFNTSVTGQTR